MCIMGLPDISDISILLSVTSLEFMEINWLLNTNQSTQSLQQKLLAATDQVVTALAAALIVSFHRTPHPSLGNLKVLEPESTTNKKLRRQGSIALWLGKSFEFICLWCDSYCHHKPFIIPSHNSNTWQCTSLNIIRIQSIHMFGNKMNYGKLSPIGEGAVTREFLSQSSLGVPLNPN